MTDALPTARDLRQLFASVAALLRDWPGYTLHLALAVTWDIAGARWDGTDRTPRWQAACAGLERLHGGRDWQGLRGDAAERLVQRALEAAERLKESGRVFGDWPPGYLLTFTAISRIIQIWSDDAPAGTEEPRCRYSLATVGRTCWTGVGASILTRTPP